VFLAEALDERFALGTAGSEFAVGVLGFHHEVRQEIASLVANEARVALGVPCSVCNLAVGLRLSLRVGSAANLFAFSIAPVGVADQIRMIHAVDLALAGAGVPFGATQGCTALFAHVPVLQIGVVLAVPDIAVGRMATGTWTLVRLVVIVVVDDARTDHTFAIHAAVNAVDLAIAARATICRVGIAITAFVNRAIRNHATDLLSRDHGGAIDGNHAVVGAMHRLTANANGIGAAAHEDRNCNEREGNKAIQHEMLLGKGWKTMERYDSLCVIWRKLLHPI